MVSGGYTQVDQREHEVAPSHPARRSSAFGSLFAAGPSISAHPGASPTSSILSQLAASLSSIANLPSRRRGAVPGGSAARRPPARPLTLRLAVVIVLLTCISLYFLISASLSPALTPPTTSPPSSSLDATTLDGNASAPSRPQEFYVVAVTMVKNMAPYLPEWIEHHLLLGIEHFVIFNNLGTDMSEEVLRPYIDEGIVEWILYPPLNDSIIVSNGVDGTRADEEREGIVWWDESDKGDRKKWLDGMWNCRHPTGHIQCQDSAFLEALARWRGGEGKKSARWLVIFDVDEFFHVPLAVGEGWPSLESDVRTISSFLRRHEHRDMVSVVGTNFGTQGYLSPPLLPPPNSSIPFPMITPLYTYRARVPFRFDRLVQGWADARKSFGDPRVASGTRVHDWTFDVSPRRASTTRIPPSSPDLRLSHFQNRAVLWMHLKAERNRNPAAAYSPARDAFLNEVEDTSMEYLHSFVRARMEARWAKGVWAGVGQLLGEQGRFAIEEAIPVRPVVASNASAPALCVAVAHVRAALPRFRKTVLTSMYHLATREPVSMAWELVIIGSRGNPGGVAALDFALDLERRRPDVFGGGTVVELEDDGRRWREAELLEKAFSRCRGEFVLSLVDDWETRLDSNNMMWDDHIIVPVGTATASAVTQSAGKAVEAAAGPLNKTGADVVVVTTTADNLTKPGSRGRRGALWQAHPKPVPVGMTANLVSVSMEILRGDGELLEIWLGDVPDLPAYRTARSIAQAEGSWHTVTVASGASVRARKQKASGSAGWWWYTGGGVRGGGEAYMGVYRHGGSVKSLARLRALGELTRFGGERGITEWKEERAFAELAAAEGYASMHLCVGGDERNGCGLDLEDGGGGGVTGLLWRGRIELSGWWFGEKRRWRDRGSVGMCYRLFGVDLWCPTNLLS